MEEEVDGQITTDNPQRSAYPFDPARGSSVAELLVSLLLFGTLVAGALGSAVSVSRYIATLREADTADAELSRLYGELDRAIRAAAQLNALPLFKLTTDRAGSCVLELHQTEFGAVYRISGVERGAPHSPVLRLMTTDTQHSRTFDRAIGFGVDGATFLRVHPIRSGSSGTPHTLRVRISGEPDAVIDALDARLGRAPGEHYPLAAISALIPITSSLRFDRSAAGARRTILGKGTAQTIARGVTRFDCRLTSPESAIRRLTITVTRSTRSSESTRSFEWSLPHGAGEEPIDLLWSPQ